MGGFSNPFLNNAFKQSLYKRIICTIIESCSLMVKQCKINGIILPNHEEKIRNYLLENYLETKNIPLRFIPEVPENYNAGSKTYSGRVDIKVVSIDWMRNPHNYYIVECKRIDGTPLLNEQYIDEGVCRFLGPSPKYISYNNKNIMLGFIVKDIDCKLTIKVISDIHAKKLKVITGKNIDLIKCSKTYYYGESTYTNGLLLGHIFYDISSIV